MTLIVVSVLAGLCLWAAPASADGDGIRCQVTTPVLRVRSAPDEAQIGSAYGGTWLTVTARDSDTAWARVNWSGREGWVVTQWLRCDSSLDDLAEAEANADTTPTVAAAAIDSPAKSVTPPSPPGLDPRAKAMFDAVNQVRANAGLGPYDLDLRAMDAAQWHADDMVARRYFAHNTPDGLT